MDVEFLQQLANATLDPETGAVIDLDDPHGQLRRLAVIASDDHRFSTPELLALEQRLVDRAVARADDGVGLLPAGIGVRTLRATGQLSDEQRRMVRRLISSGAGVEVVVGKAGSGKTTALAAAHDAWRQAGVPVVGCALAARAALELERGSGIRSSTIHRLLTDLDRYGDRAALHFGSVLVVDEAGMVGTRMLARLLEHAQQQDVKVVLVGDHHQLPEIDAGGAFAALANRLDAIELTDNRRQREFWERDALDALRHGDPSDAIAAYTHHDRITTAQDTESVREQLVGDWWTAAVERGLDGIMIAARNTDIADLNARARRRLTEDGALSGPELQVAGRTFQVNDRIVCLRNDRNYGVINGMRGTVTALHAPSQALAFRPADDPDRVIVLRFDYLDAGHVDHAYAITAHKAQGMTCDATFVLADEAITREWGYVALSRGRRTNRLYLADGNRLDLDPGAATHPETLQPEVSLADSIIQRLRRSGGQQLASQLEADPDLTPRLTQQLQDLETHRQRQERELDRSFGIGY